MAVRIVMADQPENIETREVLPMKLREKFVFLAMVLFLGIGCTAATGSNSNGPVTGTPPPSVIQPPSVGADSYQDTSQPTQPAYHATPSYEDSVAVDGDTLLAVIMKGDVICLDETCGKDFPKSGWWKNDFMIEVKHYRENGVLLHKGKILYSGRNEAKIHHAECSPKLTSRDAVYDYFVEEGYSFTISKTSLNYAVVHRVPRRIFLKLGGGR